MDATSVTPTTVTTARDVMTHFAAPGAQRALAGWRADPRYTAVVPHVEGHATRIVYRLTSAEIAEACELTAHALGTVERDRAESVEQIVDWNPAFAFTHLLHHIVEQTEAVPTWRDFVLYYRNNRMGRLMLGDAVDERTRELVENGFDERLVDDAMRWRIGNAYYSFLRELWVVVNLREAGVDVRIHPLADALLRVDAWCGQTALIIYVSNSKYRKGHTGRKIRAADLLRGASPPFKIETVELQPRKEYGKVHLPTQKSILIVAARLRR
ncbi:hypothetical protein [Catellatospora paridis]|uniref:hypothetical protein n=1 Tax=Catellatospora paridis TaxID=1617086 RepID=UPI0012D44A84|nr:hypothetical protein [Catellatospora paridis]